MFESQKSGIKTSSGEIGLNIRTLASPKVYNINIKVCLWNTTVSPRWQQSPKNHFKLQGQSHDHKVIDLGVIW